MDEKRYLIGEVSSITGISRDTLRFWDKIGLLKPKYVDPHNGYRYYTYDQFWRMDIISCCRSLDISIDTIRGILESGSNDKVLTLLQEHQREAQDRMNYYRQVVDDIGWFAVQDERIKEAKGLGTVTVRHQPERGVLYGNNDEDTRAYHLRLLELCREAVDHSQSIRRGYGFILDERRMAEGGFIKRGEYIRFDQDIMKTVDPAYLTMLPAGDYACCMINVINDRADFTPLLNWLKENDVEPSYVIADEIGLRLFEYLDHGYLCEVKVLLN